MKSFIILGLGRFGISVAQTLCQLGYDVLGVDEDDKIVHDLSRCITHVIQADITSEEFLRSMDIAKFDAAIIAVGSSIQVSILVTVLLKDLGAKFILAKAQDDFQEKILYRVGADKVIMPEKDIGIKTARNLATDDFFDMLEISPDYSITSVTPPESWYGKTLGELGPRSEYRINILAVKNGMRIILIPDANTHIEHECALTIMGMNDDIKRFRNVK